VLEVLTFCKEETQDMPKVSICIPTYKRPDLLKVALDSCLAQTFQDFEVVIVDDSPDVLTENMIRNMRATRAIEYVRNAHRTGQANSKNQLFDLARGEFIVLLHDDNILMPTALDDLIKPLQKNPAVVASFGKQYWLTHEGSILEAESARLNERYFRTDDRGNQVQPSEWSALVQQFPGDSFMIRSVDARKTRYREDVGECCDAEFGWRLCKLGAFFFVGKYAAADRRNQEGLTASGFRIHLSNLYPVLERTPVSRELESLRTARLEEMAPVAVSGCLLRGGRLEALKILFGKNYPWRRKFMDGVAKLGLVFTPRVMSNMILNRKP
jgi:glycosyltransferase involved in cell wall biosynthesis